MKDNILYECKATRNESRRPDVSSLETQTPTQTFYCSIYPKTPLANNDIPCFGSMGKAKSGPKNSNMTACEWRERSSPRWEFPSYPYIREASLLYQTCGDIWYSYAGTCWRNTTTNCNQRLGWLLLGNKEKKRTWPLVFFIHLTSTHKTSNSGL